MRCEHALRAAPREQSADRRLAQGHFSHVCWGEGKVLQLPQLAHLPAGQGHRTGNLSTPIPLLGAFTPSPEGCQFKSWVCQICKHCSPDAWVAHRSFTGELSAEVTLNCGALCVLCCVHYDINLSLTPFQINFYIFIGFNLLSNCTLLYKVQ